MIAGWQPAKVPTDRTKPSWPKSTIAASALCISQNSGQAAMKAKAVAASMTGRRPTRSDSQAMAIISGSSRAMLMVLMSSARAGGMPSASCSQLTM
jgi:hypothetical protein